MNELIMNNIFEIIIKIEKNNEIVLNEMFE